MHKLHQRDRLRLLHHGIRVGLRRLRRRQRRAQLRRLWRIERIRSPRSGLADQYAALAQVQRFEVRKGRTRVPISFPKTFSFIDAPDDAITALEAVVRAALSRPKEILFDQKACEAVDLCAASVLNALAREFKSVYRVTCAGLFPASEEAHELVRATGLPKVLDALAPSRHPKDFLHFPLREGQRTPPGAKRANESSRAASDLTTYVNDCLGQFDFELSSDANEYLSSLVGEVIDNAEEHSGSPRWWVAGYLRRRPGESSGDCHITIFNFGATLAESLQRLPADSAVRGGIEPLVDLHRRRFFLSNRKWTEENLWTLYALQEGVSQKNRQRRGEPIGNRGQGTVRMIRYFQELASHKDGKHPSAMTVVSGRTWIRFDPSYQMRPMPQRSGPDRQIIAFNDSNRLELPPDAKCVQNLGRYFPGTIISLRFYLDRDFLEELNANDRAS